jgi:hypothetical protein
MTAPLKRQLEGLLKQRRLQAEAPPLRGETRWAPLPSGIAPLDAALGGGLPRGQLSELHGPPSSGRTGLALSAVAQATAAGALAAWIDPDDRFDPASAGAAGAELGRLLWLRGGEAGPGLKPALAAAATLAGSGLFELLVLDLAATPPGTLRRLPGATWIRLQRAVAETRSALLLLGGFHLACGPGGARLALDASRPLWSGRPGPGRLLSGLGARAVAGRHATRCVSFELRASH